MCENNDHLLGRGLVDQLTNRFTIHLHLTFFSENTRTPSISGEAQCMPQEKCSYDKKSCIGKTHKFGGKVNSIEDCKNQCKIHTDCTWVNYDRSTSFCTLLKNCMDMKVCAECVTANGKDCSISKNAGTLVCTLISD